MASSCFALISTSITGFPRNRLFNPCAKVLGVSHRIRIAPRDCKVAKAIDIAAAKILGTFVESFGLGTINAEVVDAIPAMVTLPNPESIEGKILVFDENGS